MRPATWPTGLCPLFTWYETPTQNSADGQGQRSYHRKSRNSRSVITCQEAVEDSSADIRSGPIARSQPKTDEFALRLIRIGARENAGRLKQASRCSLGIEAERRRREIVMSLGGVSTRGPTHVKGVFPAARLNCRPVTQIGIPNALSSSRAGSRKLVLVSEP
jgi:hypothetical protein